MGDSRPRRQLYPGVYGPLPTFFDDKQDLDFISYKSHLLNLAHQGVVPVCLGSLGEAVHLDREERVRVISFVRETLDQAGLLSTPIVAGVGGASTRETIRLAHDAAGAGADAGMVILPGYYAASLDQDQWIQYFVDICSASPIPILLYNFPANSAGQDMCAGTIEAIMARCPNLCGVKLTCPGSIPKLTILQSAVEKMAPRSEPFLFLDGIIGDMIPWVKSGGGHGTVSGLPNFAPRVVARFWSLLSKENLNAAEMEEMRSLQVLLASVDVKAFPAGVRGMNGEADVPAPEYVLHKTHGYEAAPRRPLLPLDESQGEALMKAMKPLLDLEAKMERSED